MAAAPGVEGVVELEGGFWEAVQGSSPRLITAVATIRYP
jgi:hypothetical protein